MKDVGTIPFHIVASQLTAVEQKLPFGDPHAPVQYLVAKRVGDTILLGYERADGTRSRLFQVEFILINQTKSRPIPTTRGWVRIGLDTYQHLMRLGVACMNLVDFEV